MENESDQTLNSIYHDLIEHTNLIRAMAFHSFPHRSFGLNPDQPHSEDCEGCVINREAQHILNKVEHLFILLKSKTDDKKSDEEQNQRENDLRKRAAKALAETAEVRDELNREIDKREALDKDRWTAFGKVGRSGADASVSDLVDSLLAEIASLKENTIEGQLVKALTIERDTLREQRRLVVNDLVRIANSMRD